MKNILIIDDEKIITKSLQKLLASRGYDVVIANSGRDALEKTTAGDFHLIICDVRMPQMDGIDTIKEIRKCLSAQGKPTIPEVIITGYADEEKYKSAVDLKVAAYLYKPFDMDELLAAVEKNIK